MAIGRVTYKLNKETSKGSANKDSYFNVNLDSEIKLLPPDKINKIVNLHDVFTSERNTCTKYRVINTILPVFSNVLFNIKGDKGPSSFTDSDGITNDKSYGWETFDGYTFKNDPNDNNYTGFQTITYEESVTKHLKEVNGWFGFYDPDYRKIGLCSFYDLEPKRSRFDLSSNLLDTNWESTITYPYANDESHYLVNNGLLITSSEVRTLGGIKMISLGTAVPHNLIVGDTVRVTDMNNNYMNGDFTVLSLGLENGDSKETFFVINVDADIATTGSLFTTGRMKRLYYGNEVKYYFRKFKKIKGYDSQKELTQSDYECYPLSFSKNIYDDQNYQIVFNDDVDVSDLTDNLGRPLSEIYLTIIKTKSKNLFTKVISGVDLENYLGNVSTTTNDDLSVSNIRKMHTSSIPLAPFQSQTPIENDVLISNNDYYGDICEYSKYEAKETILLPVMHRFNTVDRETTIIKPLTDMVINGPRLEGYMYKPHHQIKIRQFSNYVEQGDSTVVGIPEYAEYLGDDKYLWRDLLDIGYNDGQEQTLDYPFLNNAHYLYNNICFVSKRQDPFGSYGLLYTKDYPRDITVDGLSNKFIIKSSGDVC
jgi:hypothetical protein